MNLGLLMENTFFYYTSKLSEKSLFLFSVKDSDKVVSEVLPFFCFVSHVVVYFEIQRDTFVIPSVYYRE